MMGRLNHDQEQFFYSFRLTMRSQGITLFGVSPRYLIWVGSIPNWRPVILGLAALRSTLSDDPDAHCRLRVWHPLGTGAVPGRSGEPGLSVVLWTFDIEDISSAYSGSAGYA